MSGKVHLEGVRELVHYLQELNNIEKVILDTRTTIEDEKAKLETAEEKQRELSNQVCSIMSEMDVEASGNYGYKERRILLLKYLAQEIARNNEEG